MNINEDHKQKINELIEMGQTLLVTFSKSDFTINDYQSWFTVSSKLVKFYLPERFEEFISYYSSDFHNGIAGPYNIKGALVFNYNERVIDWVKDLFKQQIGILISLKDSIDKKINDISLDIEYEFKDTELATAKQLIKINLRASGCIAGVVLERHLKTVLNKHIPDHGKKDKELNLGNINDLLKEVAYDLATWRKISYLVDLRNICDHNKVDRNGLTVDPTEENVKDLIDGTEKIINTII